jgi:regulator of replication initiation timing
MLYCIKKNWLPIIILVLTAVPELAFATGVTETTLKPTPVKVSNSINASQIEYLPSAGLDPTTIELFTGAVADLHETAKNLNHKLARIEDRVRLLRAENELLRNENRKVRKLARMKTEIDDSKWARFPLDNEVKEANEMLENLVKNLTGLIPFNADNLN